MDQVQKRKEELMKQYQNNVAMQKYQNDKSDMLSNVKNIYSTVKNVADTANALKSSIGGLSNIGTNAMSTVEAIGGVAAPKLAQALSAASPVGTALMTGYSLYKMLDDNRKKKQQEAMALSQQEMNNSINANNDLKNETILNMQNQQESQNMNINQDNANLLNETNGHGFEDDNLIQSLNDNTHQETHVQPDNTNQIENMALQDNKSNRIAQLMNDFKLGYEDNTQNNFNLANLSPDNNKNFANRLGEAFGTGQRFISNPWVQGIIAGGIDYANGNDFGDSALTGINWAQQKAKSDSYRKMINPEFKGRSTLGGYSADDYKVYAEAERKKIQSIVDQLKAKSQQDKIDSDIKFNNWKMENGDKIQELNEMFTKWKMSDGDKKTALETIYKTGMLGVAKQNAQTNSRKADETQRHNMVNEGISQQNANTNSQKANETTRHNKANENIAQQNVNINRDKLVETKAHNRKTELINQQRIKEFARHNGISEEQARKKLEILEATKKDKIISSNNSKNNNDSTKNGWAF